MTRTRAFATLAFAAAVTGALSLTLAAPIAHADPADPVVYKIAQTVKADRYKYGPQCPPLRYSGELEAAAQRYTAGDLTPGNYIGEIRGFKGSGDRQAAATTNAYKAGAGPTLSVCEFTEFGAAFVYQPPGFGDIVTIVFGNPMAR